MTSTGVLLINLGTPKSATKTAVRRYLREFLNDPKVITLPKLIRWVLVNLFIIPFRVARSTDAYQQIWTKEGSPLLINSLMLQQHLADNLGDHYKVVCGMRYGSPSIFEAYQQLQNCNELIVIPLFPQYSSAATGSVLENFFDVLALHRHVPSLSIISSFYNNAGFIESYRNKLQAAMTGLTPDFILLSYHGLPQHHLYHRDCSPSCNMKDACPAISAANRWCYRAQCYATSKLLAQSLHLATSQFGTAFQSRLGKTPWIKPYTDEMLQQLIRQGIKKLVVACPSFVADCLETLEEMGIRAREQWRRLGGSDFILVPCLNGSSEWVSSLANIVVSNQKGE